MPLILPCSFGFAADLLDVLVGDEEVHRSPIPSGGLKSLNLEADADYVANPRRGGSWHPP
jgi:hypothetical protein